MTPFALRSIDMTFDPGHPARVSIELSGAIRLAGIQVWRTSRGPRVLFPGTASAAGRGMIAIPPSLRRDWNEAILAAWRRATSSMTESVIRSAAA